MPFYEYECSNCKFYTEVMQKISDTPLTKCPSCGKSALVKLVSAPNFRLKGGGWYETDFKGNGEKKRNLVETASGDSSESSAASTDSAKDSAKDSASKEATAKVADAKSADTKGSGSAGDAGKKPEPAKVGTAPARTSAAKRRAKTSTGS